MTDLLDASLKKLADVLEFYDHRNGVTTGAVESLSSLLSLAITDDTVDPNLVPMIQQKVEALDVDVFWLHKHLETILGQLKVVRGVIKSLQTVAA